jgi:hypothetical protein
LHRFVTRRRFTAAGLLSPEQEARIMKLLTAAKGGKTAATDANSIKHGHDAIIDLVRDVANLGAVVDTTNVLAVVAAYMYPVLGE